jgi:NTP pyrophosphatase (non-canonical NTP hydrolase)
MINHAEMVRTLAKPGEAILAEMTPKKCALIHMSACIMEEVGELIEGVNAIIVDDKNILEESGDVEFYFEGLIQELELDLVVEHINQCSLLMLAVAAADLYGSIKPHLFYNKPLDLELVASKASKFRATLSGIYLMLSINEAGAKAANTEKLGKRYEGFKYSNESAVARADKI